MYALIMYFIAICLGLIVICFLSGVIATIFITNENWLVFTEVLETCVDRFTCRNEEINSNSSIRRRVGSLSISEQMENFLRENNEYLDGFQSPPSYEEVIQNEPPSYDENDFMSTSV